MYVIYIFFKGDLQLDIKFYMYDKQHGYIYKKWCCFGQAAVCDQLWSNGNDEGFFFYQSVKPGIPHVSRLNKKKLKSLPLHVHRLSPATVVSCFSYDYCATHSFIQSVTAIYWRNLILHHRYVRRVLKVQSVVCLFFTEKRKKIVLINIQS